MTVAPVFAAEPGAPPVVAIRPCVEALLSIRLGDDPAPHEAFWDALFAPVRPRTRHVFDNRPGEGALQPASERHASAIGDALDAAARGPDAGRAPAWATTTFVSSAGPDEIPEHSASVSLGWIQSARAPRGLSLRITTSPDADWGALAALAERLAGDWPKIFRWITVGYRFVTVPWHSQLLPEALSIVHGRSGRFGGVDVGDPFGLATSFWQDRLRTVGWVTIVSGALVDEAAPGLDPTAGAGEGVEVKRVGGGFVLRAGESPSMLDRNRRDDPSCYRRADRALAPLRAREGVYFLPPWTEAESRTWLHRLSG